VAFPPGEVGGSTKKFDERLASHLAGSRALFLIKNKRSQGKSVEKCQIDHLLSACQVFSEFETESVGGKR